MDSMNTIFLDSKQHKIWASVYYVPTSLFFVFFFLWKVETKKKLSISRHA